MSTDKYNDIIGMAHHTSPVRKRMSMHDRAAQFAPFAALTGYDSLVEETARLTDTEISMGEEGIAELDIRLRILKQSEAAHPYIEVTHFIPDKRKSGGSYKSTHAHLLRIDEHEKLLLLSDGSKISFEHISAISSLLFTDE